MPKRPRSHILEDLSKIRLHRAFTEQGWTAENLDKDYGEDLFVRLFEDCSSTPFSFFVQAKATDEIGRYIDKNGEVIQFPIETGHLRHWIRFPEPVFLTIWDSLSDHTYWVCIQDALSNNKTVETALSKKTLRIHVPCRNLLNEDGLIRMSGITKMRLTRLHRQEIASDALANLLSEKLKRKISYSTENEMITFEGTGGVEEVLFFGNLAKHFEQVCVSLQISQQDAFDQALQRFFSLVESMTPRELKEWLREREARQEREAADIA